jgi:hypothetical protein
VSSAEERIKDLARKNAIDPAEAERLLAAIRPVPVPSRRAWNPFERWSATVASIVGLLASLVGFAISTLLGFRYDGAFDLHASKAPVSTTTALVDQLVAFPVTALVFWGVGYIVTRKVRLIDVIGTVGLARTPLVLLSLPLALLAPRLSPPGATPSVLVYALILVAVIGTALQVSLLVFGYRTATGLRGPRLTLSFVGALIVAEIVTKLLLDLLPR